MAAAPQHRSMLPTIKCSSCATEIDISMVGEHQCSFSEEPNSAATERTPTPTPTPPVAPFQAPPKHSSPLHQEVPQDEDLRSRSPSPIFDHSGTSILSKPSPIDSSVSSNLGLPSDPLTPAESLKASESSPVSPQESASAPYLEPPHSVLPHAHPLTPRSAPSSAQGSRPASPDLFSSRPPVPRYNSSPDAQNEPRPRSPLKSQSNPVKPMTTHQPSALPALQVKIPTQHERSRRSPSGSSLHEITDKHRKKLSNGGSPEDKKILGLFRRKSTRNMSRSISKKDITSPILERSEKIPTIPGVPVALLQQTSASPQSPGVGLPSGPAPPRPARPETMVDLMDEIKANGSAPSQRPPTPEETHPEPKFPDVEVTTVCSVENKQHLENSDASLYAGDHQLSQDRPSHSSSGLPQISEEGTAPDSPVERNPPPSAWQSDRFRQSSGSRHTPSESASSSGSRFGFDDRSVSSLSSPPTSSASSFQFKDSAEDSKSVPSFNFEASSASLKIPTSPRAANFSRPRGPTVGSSPLLHGPALSPTISVNSSSVGGESPQEPVTPHEGRFDDAPVLHRDVPTLQPTLQAVSYQRPPQKPLLQPFVKPPLPPMPEEPVPAPVARPNLSRSKSTASRGQCRGCKQEITGRSVKAADGRLTGRWHRECFVCKTCREPFQTADFYVLRDEAYCSHHYHVLNNSLCRYCHTGIEGRYFEIDGRRRFHTGCFFCAECRRPLAGDYFEMGNRFYCEIDAQRFHQRTNHLNPGRRFPERRTTKLMMM